MINFATSQGVSIPEGVVTQIADASGRILWIAKPVILQVEKIVSDTYAGETTYTGEEFVLLDIYPKTNGTVKVTYGGLTKTITDTSGAETPNAQQVFFGTFNGVSDSVTTPASGKLVIEGAYKNFACGSYSKDSKNITHYYCGCITAVNDWGLVKNLANSAFRSCTGLTNITLPSEFTSISASAFYGCTGLTDFNFPDGVTKIGGHAFSNCTNLALTSLPSGITSIGDYAFYSCFNLKFSDAFFNNGLISIGDNAFDLQAIPSDSEDDEDNPFIQSCVITIPSTVTNIGSEAFTGPIVNAHTYTYFYRVTVLATTPPTYPADVLYKILGEIKKLSEFSIIVPKGCGEAYKAASGWSYYEYYIVEAS